MIAPEETTKAKSIQQELIRKGFKKNYEYTILRKDGTRRILESNAILLKDDYGKGYDRLTGGLNFNQFIGYFYMGNTRVLNFYAGFEFYQAFTKCLRDRNFDQLLYDPATDTYEVIGKDNSNKIDLFFGIKIGWMIPVYNRAPDNYYYN